MRNNFICLVCSQISSFLKPHTLVQSKSGLSNLMKRQEADEESVEEEEETGAAEEDTSDTEQKTAPGLDPLGQALEDVTSKCLLNVLRHISFFFKILSCSHTLRLECSKICLREIKENASH